MKQGEAPAPFVGYYVYGPYRRKKSWHEVVVLVPMDKTSALKRTTTTHLRYCASVHLGRRLEPTEHVTTKNDDTTNEHPGNLEVVPAYPFGWDRGKRFRRRRIARADVKRIFKSLFPDAEYELVLDMLKT